MFKRLSALIWLRTQIFITNKNILIPVLMPYFMVLLLKFVMNTDSSKGLDLMSLCFSMAIGMAVGSPISAMIAEEKENFCRRNHFGDSNISLIKSIIPPYPCTFMFLGSI